MANKELMVTLGLDSSTFTQKVKKAKDLNKELDKSFELLSSSSKNFENSVSGLGKKQDYLNKKMKLASSESDIYAERLKECQLALEESQSDAKKYGAEVERLSKIQARVSDNLGETSKEYGRVSEELKSATQLLDKANKAWIANDKRVTDASIGYKNAQISVQQLGREATLTGEKMSAIKADDEMKVLSNAIAESQRGFENLKNSVVGFENNMEGLDKIQTHYNMQLKQTSQLMEKQQSELGSSKQILSDYEAELSKISIELKEWESLLDSIDSSHYMFDEAKDNVEGLRYEYSSLNKTVEFHKERVENLAGEYRTSEASISKFKQQLDSTAKKMVEMNNKVTFEPIQKQIKELANGDIVRLEKQLDSLENEFKDVVSEAKGFENSLDGLIYKQAHFNKAFKLAENTFLKYRLELNNVKEETANLTKEQEELAIEIKKQIALKEKLKGVDFDNQVKSIENLNKRYNDINKELEIQSKKMKVVEKGYDSSKKKVKEFSKELSDTNKEMDKLSRQRVFDDLDKSIERTKKEVEGLDRSLKLAKSEVDNFDKTQRGVAITTENYAKKVQLLENLLKQYKFSLIQGRAEVERLETEQKKLGASCDILRAKLRTLDADSPDFIKTLASITQLEAKMNELSDEANRFAKANDNIQRELDSTTAETNELTNAQKRLSREYKETKLEGMATKFHNIGNSLSSVGSQLSMVSMGTAGAMGAMVKHGAEFEESMSRVRALTGATGEEFEKLEISARKMGSETVFTAKESADALSYLALAGYNTNQAIDALPFILQSAQAGAMDLATASDKATDSISSLGYIGEDAVKMLPEYLNKVARASAKSNTSMEQMMDAYIKVGGQVENLNIELDESATMLGVLANRGIKCLVQL